SPCDTPAPVPAIPAARDFRCPKGAERFEKGGGIVGCRLHDGTESGDELLLTDSGGTWFTHHGLNLAWIRTTVRFFHTQKDGKPVGPAVWRDSLGRVAR